MIFPLCEASQYIVGEEYLIGEVSSVLCGGVEGKESGVEEGGGVYWEMIRSSYTLSSI